MDILLSSRSNVNPSKHISRAYFAPRQRGTQGSRHRNRHQFRSIRRLRRSVKDLRDDALRLDREELVKRFNWLRCKAQAYSYRRHGFLYRFDPDVSITPSLAELRLKLIDELNRFLIWLTTIQASIKIKDHRQ